MPVRDHGPVTKEDAVKSVSIALWLALVTSTGAEATTWVVDQGGAGNFVTIQEAIGAAASGDEIVVHPGTYFERIDFLGRDLWIHTSEGPGVTAIDAANLGSCAVFVSGETLGASLEGFTLTHGAGTLYAGFTRGGAVFCKGAQCTLRDCLITDNEALNAGGVQVMEDAGAELFGCTLSNNVCHRYGGAIAASNGFLNLDGCLIENNFCDEAVGGVSYAQQCQGEIRNCVFRHNQSPWVGALNLGQPTSDVTVSTCLFVDNHSAGGAEGGGIRVYGGRLYVEGCVFADNTCGGYGGALAGYDGATVEIDASTFYHNGAALAGGNIWFGDSQGHYSVSNTIIAGALQNHGLEAPGAFLTCCDAWDNAGGNYAGMPDPTGSGGNISADPLFCDAGTGDLTIRSDSPCAAEQNPPCGLIGALDVGCTPPTPAESVTWGQVKSKFMR